MKGKLLQNGRWSAASPLEDFLKLHFAVVPAAEQNRRESAQDSRVLFTVMGCVWLPLLYHLLSPHVRVNARRLTRASAPAAVGVHCGAQLFT